MKHKLTGIVILVSMFIQIIGTLPVTAVKLGDKTITSAGAFIMDYNTGDELFSFNPDSPRAPGSMTKIMSLYVVLEAIHNGEISYDTVTHISGNTYNISRNPTYQSVLPLYYDTDYRVDELMDIVLVYSACGATLALAELVCGNENGFVSRMNNTAKRMGIDARYIDCMGIANNQVTPRAMATLARNIITDYPEILDIAKKKSVRFHGRSYSTTNYLLNSYYYEGADGLKTGTTGLAGYCFCGTAKQNGERVITVTMASASTGQRFIDTRYMLDYGFAAIESKKSIFTIAMRAFINDYEIPCFYSKKYGGAMIIAEDLANYGYDLNYDYDNQTLYLTYNPQKQFTPLDMSYYNSFSVGYPFMKYYEPCGIDVVIQKGSIILNVEAKHMLNGYMAISIDEIAELYTSFGYDAASDKIHIY